MDDGYMAADPIAGATRTVATEQDEFEDLQIRDETMSDGTNVMVSKWTPTSKQLTALLAGGSIYLGVMGDRPPPVVMRIEICDTNEGS